MTIALIGYMGSGKSQIGLELSKTLNYKFLDFDAYLEEKEQMPVKEIFKSKGELYFRKLETKYLAQVLQLENSIISLGGGTPCYGNNMDQIVNAIGVKSVYLKTSIPTLCARLFDERAKRPLIAHLNAEADLQEFIGKHLFERSIFYMKASHSIQTDGKTVEQLAQELAVKLL
ncbi:shikimate kinase [Subsaximicrobium wynnwilliamsii]|uniref:Shikimate kinase n=1 Tax=Subsaximicrobium wynnwilliamsii TaxID=291179 RepID=A0A5C6ZC39_9FLAO|nr:shikimate kinase [Subsaximicrobium wynnwilliamsii]TXD81249.1 shikimate kinase [Subsaximicrobium wynnwilliamsii]TXD86950.1 shikimate kinase [Subsaximicrobium wynnwilliamsii]TXE00570.1 shikimate kinase [Subsaximicrobium wynnwilliamsii]